MPHRSSWLLCMILALIYSQLILADETLEATTSSLSRGMDPKDPYYDLVAREPSELSGLGSACDTTEISDCFGSIDQYFDEEPIWVSSQLQNRMFGPLTLESSVLNPRNDVVWYGYDDYLVESLPLWQDIFDSQIKARTDSVARILGDVRCRSLASSMEVGITNELTEYCAAEELFKYAILLDVCLTSKARLEDIFDSELMTRYVMSRPRNRAGELARNAYIRESWIQQQCLESSIELITGTTSLPLSLDQPIDDLVEVTQDTHDLVLEIAARSGNPWAMVSYLPDAGDVAYLEDLYSVNPLLTHRFLAAQRSTLSLEERSKHALEGYTLLDNPAVELQWYLTHLIGLMKNVAWDTTMITSGVDVPLTLPWRKPNEAATNR